jgi:peptidoglycan/xylan/chitin deacetylase (PgdA/CDA1 family)
MAAHLNSARTHLAAAVKAVMFATGFYERRLATRPAPTLTSLMFHRVLPPSDPQRRASFDEYVLSEKQFEAALDVTARLYQPVPLDAVLDHLAGGRTLPPRAALITFDDGWRDTLEIAAPILRRRSLPAVVFVPPLAVGQELPFWQERLLLAARTGTPLAPVAATLGLPEATPPETLAARLTDLPAARRPTLPDATDGTRHMLTAEELRRLPALGIAIGAHGLDHEALTVADDPAATLRESRERLSDLAGHDIRAMSFPHGRQTPEILRAAAAAGFRALFGSDAAASALPAGPAALFGRINISPARATSGAIADELTGRPVRPAITAG